ncbi:MAG: hypothetical protein KatS3mg035_2279 [Bacteroidia bacterium]|nr:MAG: hypothetical protein KatS3mg035_2279 [Bacteroidia bacterium]
MFFIVCVILSFQFQRKNCLNLPEIINLVQSQLNEDTVLKKGVLIDSISISLNYYYELNELNENLDTLFFSNRDIKNLTCQAKEQLQYQYWHQILGSSSAIVSDSIIEKEILNNGWESYRNKYGRGFYSYSFPLLNAKANKAIMIKDYTCGPFCGFTKILLFVRENNKWICCKEIIKGKR